MGRTIAMLFATEGAQVIPANSTGGREEESLRPIERERSEALFVQTKLGERGTSKL